MNVVQALLVSDFWNAINFTPKVCHTTQPHTSDCPRPGLVRTTSLRLVHHGSDGFSMTPCRKINPNATVHHRPEHGFILGNKLHQGLRLPHLNSEVMGSQEDTLKIGAKFSEIILPS